MTKKNYFMALWGLCSVAPVAKAIQMLMATMSEHAATIDGQTVGLPEIPSMMIMLGAVLAGICMNGFFLSLGMDFAKKVGIRLLFLEESVDWRKDFFKPAVVIGTLYACCLLLINFFMPLLVPFSLYAFISWYPIVYGGIIAALSAISEDAFGMLFVFSGIALLMSKIAKNISMSVIMPVTIVMIIVVPKIAEYIWQVGTDAPITMNMSQVKIMIDMLLVYTLCWRKSFETALLCHVVTVIILSFIVPAVVMIAGM